MRRRAEAVAPWLPALLLTGVALHQIALAELRDLSPWLGGGFGMFASAEQRELTVTAGYPGLERPVRLGPELADTARRARDLPDPARLDALARRIAEDERRRLQRLPEEVRIDVWRIRFEPGSLTPQRVRIRRHIHRPETRE